MRGGQSEAAELHLLSLAGRSPAWRSRALLEVGWARYAGGTPDTATRALRSFLSEEGLPREPGGTERAWYLLGWALLSQDEGAGAAQAFATPAPFLGQKPLTEAALRWKELPRKSPALAGVLSVVPGAGHVYIGEPVTGLAAFVWNGLFVYALYESIRREQVGVAVLLGVLESIWYTGTVFGAVSGAQKYNRDVRREALERLRTQYDDRPESWPPRPVAP